MKKIDGIEEYIKLQRTQCKGNWFKTFQRSVFNDYTTMKKHIKRNTKSILDIGCGIGGIDVVLYQKLNNPDLHLFDSFEPEKEIYYGYQNKTSQYNDLKITRKFLTANGVEPESIYTHDIKDSFPEGNYDLIISLISCGFHYPVSTYLEDISENLIKNGILILDIRKYTNQLNVLASVFGNIEIISEYQKYYRIKCKK